MNQLCTNDYLSLLQSCKKIWATSYSVDEHEAWGLFWQLLNGELSNTSCYLRYHQSAFRRAGNGILSRKCITHTPLTRTGKTIASYHPKLLLAQLTDGTYKLIISTANIAIDDFRQTSNIAVALDVTEGQSKRIQEWIKQAPKDHRSLNLHYTDGKLSVINCNKNEPTIKQILKHATRCNSCNREDQWLVASPFWSASVFKAIFSHNSNSEVTAYFRNQSTLDNISRHTSVNSNAKKITAYSLKDNGGDARWHHKVLAWRCCNKPGANALIYLGSANATSSGMTGINGIAVNWESGLIESGKATNIWEKANFLAKAGLKQGKKLSIKKNTDSCDEDSEYGLDDVNDIKDSLSPFVYDSVQIDKNSRTITRIKNRSLFTLAGKKWEIKDLHVIEDDQRKQWRKDQSKIKKDAIAQLIAQVQSEDSKDTYTVLIDITELDPEPEPIQLTQSNSINAARNILLSYLHSGEPVNTGKSVNTTNDDLPMLDDVRFPFEPFFICRLKNPNAAKSWIDNLINQNGIFQHVPHHWIEIARELKNQ